MSVLRFTYRDILKEHLLRVQRKNPAYSIRAFARDVNLAHTSLGAVLRGKKNLSVETAYNVAKKLHFDDKTLKGFCLLVDYEHTKTPERKRELLQECNSLLAGGNQILDLDLDAFETISEWYHYPLFVVNIVGVILGCH